MIEFSPGAQPAPAPAQAGGGFVLSTPHAIEYYRLCAIRGALKIETKTKLRVSRGRSASSIARALLGTRATGEALLAEFEQALADFRAANHDQIAAGTEAH